MTDALVDSSRAQTALVDALSSKYAGRLDRGRIEAFAAAAWAEIGATARFDTYVSVLARKATEQQIRLALEGA